MRTVGKRLIERQLRSVGQKLRRLRAELAVIDAQLGHLAEESDDLALRSIVADRSDSTREHRQARAHTDAMSTHRLHVIATIAELELRQDALLDRLGGLARFGLVNSRG